MKEQIRPPQLLGSVLLGITIGLLGFTGMAYADTIGPNCGSCDGATYTLIYPGSALPDADPSHETFRIELDIDTNT